MVEPILAVTGPLLLAYGVALVLRSFAGEASRPLGRRHARRAAARRPEQRTIAWSLLLFGLFALHLGVAACLLLTAILTEMPLDLLWIDFNAVHVIGLALAIPGLALAAWAARAFSSPRLPLCIRCRHDLTGLPHPPRCPECGRQHASLRQAMRRFRRRRAFTAGVLAMLLGTYLFTQAVGFARLGPAGLISTTWMLANWRSMPDWLFDGQERYRGSPPTTIWTHLVELSIPHQATLFWRYQDLSPLDVRRAAFIASATRTLDESSDLRALRRAIVLLHTDARMTSAMHARLGGLAIRATTRADTDPREAIDGLDLLDALGSSWQGPEGYSPDELRNVGIVSLLFRDGASITADDLVRILNAPWIDEYSTLHWRLSAVVVAAVQRDPTLWTTFLDHFLHRPLEAPSVHPELVFGFRLVKDNPDRIAEIAGFLASSDPRERVGAALLLSSTGYFRAHPDALGALLADEIVAAHPRAASRIVDVTLSHNFERHLLEAAVNVVSDVPIERAWFHDWPYPERDDDLLHSVLRESVRGIENAEEAANIRSTIGHSLLAVAGSWSDERLRTLHPVIRDLTTWTGASLASERHPHHQAFRVFVSPEPPGGFKEALNAINLRYQFNQFAPSQPVPPPPPAPVDASAEPTTPQSLGASQTPDAPPPEPIP